MQKKYSISVVVILLWLASLACAGTVPVPTLDPNAAQTAIVETMVAIQLTESAIPAGATTPTLDSPTATAFPTFTPEPTSTPTVPTITVTVDTNCRTGPGKEFERVGILLVGETTEIVGRDAFGQYWYVRNPDVGPDFCWMSGEYAIISGNTLALLVQNPQGMDFTAEYRGQGQCSGEFWSDIRLTNTSRGMFKSINLVATDKETGDVRSYSGNEFSFRDGCAPIRGTSSIAAESSVMISTPAFPYNLNAHNMSVAITLCADASLSGQCVTKIITYTP